MSLHIRSLTSAAEVSWMIELARIEGWQPGLKDAKCFFMGYPTGFFVGELEHRPDSSKSGSTPVEIRENSVYHFTDARELIGCISVVSHSPSLAFIGFYIIKQQFRGLGFGMKLWNGVLQPYLSDPRMNLCLDAVPEQVQTYKRCGFVPTYNTHRFGTSAFHISKSKQKVNDI